MSELDKVVEELGQHYAGWKHSEKMKNKLKDEFFKLVTEQLAHQVPAQIYEKITGVASEDEARRLARKKFPTYNVLDVLPEYDGWRVVLEENPEYQSFSYEGPDGMTYTRQVNAGEILLDDERLQEKEPDLWEAVSYIPEPKRVLKPLEELSPEELAALEPYLYSGKPVVKLAPPRKVEEEEDD